MKTGRPGATTALEVARLHDAGHGIASIANRLECSPRTVYRYLAKTYGPRTRTAVPREKIPEVVAHWRRCGDDNATAFLFGISPSTVRAYVRQAREG